MPTSLRQLLTSLALLVVCLVPVAASAQTPDAAPADPCASYVPATPGASGSVESAATPTIPDISAEQAVIGSLTIHQQNVVTTLQVISASGDDDELESFATGALPGASRLLETLTSAASDDVTGHPAAMVAVLDALRQEQDLPADQGGLDAYRPGSVLETLCRDGIDRQAAAIQALIANDTAIVEIAALGELVVGDDAIEIVGAVASAARDRLEWLDARAADATPMATPAP